MSLIVWEHYDGKTHREECAEILADAYMVLKKNIISLIIHSSSP